MPKKINKNVFLLEIYHKVNNFIDNNKTSRYTLGDVIISFCILSERLMKMQLHKKNKFLPYQMSTIRDENMIFAIASGKYLGGSINSLTPDELFNRYCKFFPKTFSEDELELLKGVFKTRNNFVHSPTIDLQSEEYNNEQIKKLGTLWPKISKIASLILGKTEIKETKPKTFYTKEELEKVLEDEVRALVGSRAKNKKFGLIDSSANDLYGYAGIGSCELCPRCGEYSLQYGHEYKINPLRVGFEPLTITRIAYGLENDASVSIYKCNKCGLELTQKQYEIVKDKKIGRSNIR